MYLKRLTLLLILYLSIGGAEAQTISDTAATDISGVMDSLNLIRSVRLFIDSTGAMNAAEAPGRSFIPLEEFKQYRRILPKMITCSYFLKFNLVNRSVSPCSIYLFPGALFDGFDIYKIKQPLEPELHADSVAGYRKLTLSAGEWATILVYLRPAKNPYAAIQPRLIAPRYLQTYKFMTISSRMGIKIYGFVISGVLLMMIMFMGANYFLSKKKEFLFNTLYSVCMFFLIFLNALLTRTTVSFFNFFMSYFDFFLLVLGTLFYISFARKFLDASVRYKSLNGFLKKSQVFIFLLLALYTVLNFFTNRFVLQSMLENITKFLILVIGVFFIILALRERNKLLNYLAAGNAALVLFSSVSLGMIWWGKETSFLFSSSLFYYYTGIAIELMFFLLGLTYKNRSELIERIKEQETMKLVAGKKEFETQIAVMTAQQDERNRISADMHDDLGAGMTTIRLYSELARNKLGGQTIPEIDKISSSANELLTKMNAIIWSMTSSNDTLGNLIAYIRSYALEYFENSGIDCHTSIPENLPNIQVIGSIRRNVFLVVKEALNNIVKHAGATRVEIILNQVQGGLTLLIQDNGKGINFNELRPFSNGLNNMKKRMSDAGCDFTIENNNGTLITIHRQVEGLSFF